MKERQKIVDYKVEGLPIDLSSVQDNLEAIKKLPEYCNALKEKFSVLINDTRIDKAMKAEYLGVSVEAINENLPGSIFDKLFSEAEKLASKDVSLLETEKKEKFSQNLLFIVNKINDWESKKNKLYEELYLYIEDEVDKEKLHIEDESNKEELDTKESDNKKKPEPKSSLIKRAFQRAGISMLVLVGVFLIVAGLTMLPVVGPFLSGLALAVVKFIGFTALKTALTTAIANTTLLLPVLVASVASAVTAGVLFLFNVVFAIGAAVSKRKENTGVPILKEEEQNLGMNSKNMFNRLQENKGVSILKTEEQNLDMDSENMSNRLNDSGVHFTLLPDTYDVVKQIKTHQLSSLF